MSTQTRRSQSSLNASADAPLGSAVSQVQDGLVHLSRSPRPYRRFSLGAKLSTKNGYSTLPAVPPSQSDSKHGIRTTSGCGIFEYLSDSGTDADDEAIQYSKALPMATVISNKGQRVHSAEHGPSGSRAGKSLVGDAQSAPTDRNTLRRFLELVSSLCICAVVLLAPEVSKSAYFNHRGASFSGVTAAALI